MYQEYLLTCDTLLQLGLQGPHWQWCLPSRLDHLGQERQGKEEDSRLTSSRSLRAKEGETRKKDETFNVKRYFQVAAYRCILCDQVALWLIILHLYGTSKDT